MITQRGDVADLVAYDICYISGPVGAGKTHLAWALAKQWFRHVAGTRPIPNFHAFYVGHLIHLLRPGNAVVIPASHGTYGDFQPATTVDHFHDVCRADLLLLDDFGADKLTDWGLEQLTTIMNSRYNEMKPTITSNVTPSDVANAVGDRLASRFMHNATVIPVISADRRRRMQ